MATVFTKIELTRVANLHLLYSLQGGPCLPNVHDLALTLSDRGVDIISRQLDRMLREEEAVSDVMAESIENAFALPSGWLST